MTITRPTTNETGRLSSVKAHNLLRAVTLGILALSAPVSALLLASCAGAPPAAAAVPAENLSLMDLISEGRNEEVKKRLAGSESVNQKNSRGQSLLHVAALRNDAETVALLLALKADPEAADALGDTPLAAAIQANCLDAAKVLASSGASLFKVNEAGKTPWNFAADAGSEAMNALISPATVAQRDDAGRSLLHYAVSELDETAVGAVVAAGAPVSLRDNSGVSALRLAYGRSEAVSAARIASTLILAGAEPEREDFGYFETAVLKRNVAMRFEEGKTPLHLAAAAGHLGFVEYLLERGAPANAKDISSSTALHEAVRYGRVDCSKRLLAAGSDPNQQDSSGNTPLHLVMPAASRSALFTALLDAGTNPNKKDSYGETPLHIAARLGMDEAILRSLVNAGADVNERNKKGVTPLSLAIERGQAAQAAVFIALGADIHAEDMEGNTAVSKALESGLEMTRAVIAPSNVQARDSRGRTPLHVAAEAQAKGEIIAYLISAGADVNARDRNGDTPLHVAVRNNDRATGELLLARGADVFTPNVAGESALRAALSRMGGRQDWVLNSNVINAADSSGNTPLHLAAEWQLTEVVAFLVEKGSDLNARNSNGETPLFNAVKADSSAAVTALLNGAGDKRADINARDFLGNTALHACVRWAAHNAARAIAERDTRTNGKRVLNARNLAGKTALHEAATTGNLSFTRFLLDFGADVNAADETGKTPLTDAIEALRTDAVRLLLSSGASAVMQDMYGRNAFHAAVEKAGSEVIILVRSSGGNPMARDSFGNTPLSLAYRKSSEAVMAVVGGNKNLVDSDGNTPLHVALASRSSPETLQGLIDSGFPVNNRNGSGATALLMAVRTGQGDSARVLLAAGADPYAGDNSGESPAALALTKQQSLLPTLAEFCADRTDTVGDGLLHYAARIADEDTVRRLLALARVDRTVRNIAGETARDIALRWQRPRIADLLK